MLGTLGGIANIMEKNRETKRSFGHCGSEPGSAPPADPTTSLSANIVLTIYAGRSFEKRHKKGKDKR